MSDSSPVDHDLDDTNEPTTRATTAASAPLTERYVAVTLGNVPHAQRDAVEPALRAAIKDEIKYRHDRLLGDEVTTRSDIEIEVLEDMGEPELVAAAMTHRPKTLVGPRFYQDFKHVLLWTLAIVVPSAAALAMVSSAQDGATLFSMIAHGAGVAATVAAYMSAWVTLGFAIAERIARHRAEVTAAEWTVGMLPAPARTVVSVAQTAVAVVSSLLVATSIVVQQLDPSLVTDAGEQVPFLNPDHWPWAWSAVVGLLAVNALFAVKRHVRGYWTARSAVINLVLLTGLYGLLGWMLLGESLLNEAFFDEVGWPTDELPTSTLEGWALIAVGVLWLLGVAAGTLRWWRARSTATV
ncbi:hypothetical protein [Demequina aurantiaca]|uniref:hypothetical protein n=1 Tax=Demequina aurantiaca TaxID=676200 RepID=UPI003D346C4E